MIKGEGWGLLLMYIMGFLFIIMYRNPIVLEWFAQQNYNRPHNH